MSVLSEAIVEADDVKPHPGRRMTEEEFVDWCDEKTWAEWVAGEVIVTSPSSVRHVDLAGFLLLLMRWFVTQRDLGRIFGPELQIRLSGQHSRRVPDLMFIAKDRLDILRPTYVEGPPDLLIEIVSPDSLARDWREKYLEYEAAGVREYWVIDPMAQRVEAYLLGEDWRYRLIARKDDKIYSGVLPGFYLKPAWLWQEPLPNPSDILKELGLL